jgi:anti-sigma regulatory factor (Ser/Thr protein kinase)
MKRDEMLKKSAEIRQYILDQVAKDPKGITAAIVQKFNISRQAASGYLRQMVQTGQLIGEGTTKDKVYKPGFSRDVFKTYDLSVPQEESEIWSKDFQKICEGLNVKIIRICEYGFTEMVNNAIDHSAGKILSISMIRDLKEVLITIKDNGIGIFRKIKEVYRLSDERQAILELSKGKLTTDPEKHSGQGIFFTSRAFDSFYINSYGLFFGHKKEIENDYLMHEDEETEGTWVMMKISLASSKTLTEIFNEFADPVDNNYSFDKTVVAVKLAQYEGESLVSRSQAKRLMARVENFRSALLDFEGVQSVGQAFADEIFRVYKSAHPNVKIEPIHTSEEIKTAIHRARAAVLDGAFQEVQNVEKLIAEGLIEPIEGAVPHEEEGSPLSTGYRIVKRDTESLLKILPHLSDRDRQKITNVMELK